MIKNLPAGSRFLNAAASVIHLMVLATVDWFLFLKLCRIMATECTASRKLFIYVYLYVLSRGGSK